MLNQRIFSSQIDTSHYQQHAKFYYIYRGECPILPSLPLALGTPEAIGGGGHTLEVSGGVFYCMCFEMRIRILG